VAATSPSDVEKSEHILQAHIGEADRGFDSHALEAFVRRSASPWWVYKSFVGWYAGTTVFGRSLSCDQVDRMAREVGFTGVSVEKVPGHPFLWVEMRNR